MKKCIFWALAFLLMAGCSGPPDEMEIGMELRSKLLQSSVCSFTAEITADYGDKVHTFALDCHSNSEGDLTFTVVEPESISGITGTLSGTGGALVFDETALHFELMADDQLSPISAPWVFLKTLRGGYIASACKENDGILLSIDDSYEDDALRLDIWLDSENTPNQADILFDGKRILSVFVDNFKIL